MKFKNLFCFNIVLFTAIVFSQNKEVENKIDSLISRMTLQEKVGQLVQYSGTEKWKEELLGQGRVGSFLNIRNVEEVNRLQKIAIEQTRLAIPLIFGNDVIHGYNTTFPIPLAQASSWNPELVEQAASISAFEAASNGTKWTFAPMVDIARDPRWGRIAEGFGEDPYLGSVMAASIVNGFQGTDISSPNKIVGCAKHYVAYGGAEGGRDYNTVDISERTLREIYLPPFKSAVDAGVGTIMSAFNEVNGMPASANYFTLTKILRDEWKFNGFVVSDWNAIGELINHGIVDNKKDAAYCSITAGIDMDMAGDTLIGNVYLNNLENLFKDGKLNENIIDTAVKRVLRIKFKAGLFDHPFVNINYFKERNLSKEEKDKTALKLSKESIVLLKNEGNILPLRKDIKSISVIGPLADNRQDVLGPWNTEPIIENVVTVLKGIKNEVSASTKIIYKLGCEINSEDKSYFEDAVNAAKISDVVLLVLGEGADMSGEAASRSNLDLPGIQEELLERIYRIGKPVILILMNGRPLSFSWAAENIPAILEAWFLGEQTGNAIADVIFGDYNPSGKLTVSFPRTTGQIPVYYNHKNTGRPFNKNDKYTSKYLDLPEGPLYPFGYGLSYTKFEYNNIKIKYDTLSSGQNNSVSIDVKNIGKVEGEEVVQLYVHDCTASITRPVQELKAFKKISLKPGESKTVSFNISQDMLSFYGTEMKQIVEPGKFEIMIGGNSDNTIKTSFVLGKMTEM